jgi:uncharacterized membrane protein
MIIGIGLVIISAAGGMYFGMLWNENIVRAQTEIHKREMDEIFEEVKRLRAQAANLIGQE